MPKERRDRSVSFDRSRLSPFPCSSSRSRRSQKPSESNENAEQWEEARCPVCMEHPHNAILLQCSSHDKGCRPYMCDTSYRHSNCFDQFKKSFSEASPTIPQQEETPVLISHSSSHIGLSEVTMTDLQGERSEEDVSMHAISCENEAKVKMVCPLCRGQINGWIVVESARRFMNAKSRSCACESCDFSGTYSDLRKHARLVHPLVHPSEADPERQRNWRRLERQRDLGDLLSTLQSSIGEDRGEESSLSFDEGGWLTVFFLIRVFRPRSSSRSSSWSGTSRTRARVTVRRRSTRRLWGESYDRESESATRDDDSEFSDGESGPWVHHEQIQRRPTPDDDS